MTCHIISIRFLCWVSFFYSCFLFCGDMAAAIFHVAPGGDDGGNGLSWGTAKRTVAAGLSAAREGDQVRVAQGNYAERISLKRGVALLGGWSGAGDVRDTALFPSVLDGGAAGVVVQALDATMTEATLIDGFVIQNGKGIMGGGVVVVGGRPTISGNWIRKNFSDGEGGGICCFFGAAPLIQGNIIHENTAFGARGDGGGICCTPSSMDKPDQLGAPSNPVIRGNRLAYNMAFQNGGAICAKGGSAPVIEGNTIVMNASSLVPSYNTGKMEWNEAGGDYVYKAGEERASVGAGGIACLEGGRATIKDNVIAGNSGLYAGGILLYDTGEGLQVINNTIAGNSPNGLHWANSAPVLANNIIVSNAVGVSRLLLHPGSPPVFKANCVFGNGVDFNGFDDPGTANGNMRSDPRLASVAFGNYHLQPNSPCRNAGTADYLKAGETDVFGKVRQWGGGVDIGAAESDGTAWSVTPAIIRVKSSGNDSGDGSGWAQAKQHVAAAITAANAAGGGEIWVAEGTYLENNLALLPFVYLYGGFRGDETRREERQPAAHATVLDGGQGGFVVRAIGGWQLSTVDGFTITRGRQTGISDVGGGLSILLSGPTIRNNQVINNTAPLGGGIGLYASTALIVDNVISQNKAGTDGQGWGGGIYAIHSTPFIQNNEMARNQASDGGGIHFESTKPYILGNRIHDNLGHGIAGQSSYNALWFNGEVMLIGQNAIYRNFTEANGAGIGLMFCPGQVIDNLIAFNATGGTQGGGVHLSHTSEIIGPLTVAHNTIVGNQCNYQKPWGMVFQGAAVCIIQQGNPNIVLANNIVVGNQTGIFNYSGLGATGSPLMVRNCVYGNNGYDYQTDYLQAGPLVHPTDINRDPQFMDYNNFDYHLASGSPCLDAGDPRYGLYADLEGVPRNLNGAPDMGAFESYSTFLNAPVGLTASKGDFKDPIHLTWNWVSNANAYEIWRRPSGAGLGAAMLVAEMPGTAASFDDGGVVAPGEYQYFVKAMLKVNQLSVVGGGASAEYSFVPKIWLSASSMDVIGAISAASPYESWRANRFTAAELADSQVAGDLADPDRDGMANLLEYAAGLDPKTPDKLRFAWAERGKNAVSGQGISILHWRMTKPAPTDVTAAVEYAPALVSGSWQKMDSQGIQVVDRGTYLEYLVPAPVVNGGSKQGFLRLQINLAR